ncbi:MAG TPA: hypothetical protein VLE97_08975 [Gaiellaceae bacterium]|nr:hypothetical protein [Gaiellaceae bacterium]
MKREYEDHVAEGWMDTPEGHLRWIEAGRVRLEEQDKDGAMLLVGSADVVRQRGCDVWLSSTELAGLVRHLAGWFAEDPTETIDEIEKAAQRVLTELDAWNDRARADEEHPPYDDLTQILNNLIVRCKGLREDVNKFVERKAKIITVAASERAD